MSTHNVLGTVLTLNILYNTWHRVDIQKVAMKNHILVPSTFYYFKEIIHALRIPNDWQAFLNKTYPDLEYREMVLPTKQSIS